MNTLIVFISFFAGLFLIVAILKEIKYHHLLDFKEALGAAWWLRHNKEKQDKLESLQSLRGARIIILILSLIWIIAIIAQIYSS